MTTIKSYRDLLVWQKAVDLVAEVYEASRVFPREEMYGLTSQIRRAAVSVPSNIAEGQGKRSTGEFQHYLGHSRGSLFEVDTQLVLAQRLGYLNESVAASLQCGIEEVGRMLNGLIGALEQKKGNGPR